MNYQNAYKQTSITTAAPGRLLVMLFDGLIRFINQARTAIEDKQIEDANNALCRSQDIVLELKTSLNRDASPELCDTLTDLYSYFYKVLLDANRLKESSGLVEILPQIQELRDAFAEAERQVSAERHNETEG